MSGLHALHALQAGIGLQWLATDSWFDGLSDCKILLRLISISVIYPTTTYTTTKYATTTYATTTYATTP